MAGAEPVPQQHVLHVAFKDGRVGVETPRQSMAGPVIVDQCF
jgi:hypothetical protein